MFAYLSRFNYSNYLLKSREVTLLRTFKSGKKWCRLYNQVYNLAIFIVNVFEEEL